MINAISRQEFLKFLSTIVYFPIATNTDFKRLWCIGDSILHGAFIPDQDDIARTIIKKALPDILHVGTLPGGHDCHDGFRSDQLAEGVLSWGFSIEPPDITWVYCGTNDVLQDRGYSMDLLVNNIRLVFPRTNIIVSRIGIVPLEPIDIPIFNYLQVDPLDCNIIDYEDAFDLINYWIDNIHLNESGQAVLAQKFIEYVILNNL